MLILKLTAIALTAAAGLLQVGLDYRWREKRTSAHKRVRWVMLATMVVAAMVASALVVHDDQEMSAQVETLQGLKQSAETARADAAARAQAAQRDRDEMKLKLVSLETAVKPIVAVATARYPQLESADALTRLADEVQSLQQRSEAFEDRTRELASRDTFRTLSPSIRDNVVRSLRAALASLDSRVFSIEIQVETGHTGRQRMALRSSVRVSSKAQELRWKNSPEVTLSKGALPAVAIESNPADENIARALASALNPFLHATFAGQKKENRQRGHLSIALNGEPMFAEDGSVTFP